MCAGAHQGLGDVSLLGIFKAVGSLWAAPKVENSTHTRLCLSRFILLGSFSDALLVVSIAICRRFGSLDRATNSYCGNYGFFLTWV